MLAVDRNNPRVADIYQDLHPAVLGAIRFVVEQAKLEHTRIGICGEIAGNPAAAILLTAMGMDVLSMNAPNLPRVKWALREIDLEDASGLLDQALAYSSAEEVVEFMRAAMVERGLGRLVGPDSRLASLVS